MNLKKYPVKYSDKFGFLKSEVVSDGSNLKIELRNTIFEGSEFESLETKKIFDNFEFNSDNELTNFELEINIPIIISSLKDSFIGELIIKLEKNLENKKLNGVELLIKEGILKTKFGNNLFSRSMYNFEGFMILIQNMLPENYEIRTCISCKYSNYHPCGSPEFGGLTCFKNIKNKVDKISDKMELMSICDEEIPNNKLFAVNEIYECPEHEFISKHDWVYKSWDYGTKGIKRNENNCT